jgi:integrase/recombinase XerD
MNPLISNFVSFLRSERGLADNTIESYENDVTQFAEFVGKPLPSVGRLDVQKFLSETAKGKSGRTAARRLACLRAFYQLLLDEEEVKLDPTKNVPAPKQRRALPRILSRAELEKMVASLGDSWIDLRDKAILLTFYASGLRANELRVLELKDLDLEAGVIKVWSGNSRPG